MKTKISFLAALAITTIAGGSAAFAQNDTRSVSQNTESQATTLKDEVWGITPQVGVLNYTDNSNNYTSRGMAGIGVNFNLAPLVFAPDNRDWYLGVSTGGLYSHTGSSNGNFFGSSGSGGAGATDSSNVIFIPADLKLGYNLTQNFRLSAHGGGNVIYRSVGAAINIGDDSETPGSIWRIYPNAGLDAEWQLGRNVSLTARPDLTFTNGNNMFVGTVGATFIGM